MDGATVLTPRDMALQQAGLPTLDLLVFVCELLSKAHNEKEGADGSSTALGIDRHTSPGEGYPARSDVKPYGLPNILLVQVTYTYIW